MLVQVVHTTRLQSSTHQDTQQGIGFDYGVYVCVCVYIYIYNATQPMKRTT
jgi:hypothetical protein